MKLIRSAELTETPASHEDPATPGVLKKILVPRELLQAGRVQMINWARLPAGRSFRQHAHHSMQEVFILISGTAELLVDGGKHQLTRGDAALIQAGEVHQMFNTGKEDVEFLAIGIA